MNKEIVKIAKLLGTFLLIVLFFSGCYSTLEPYSPTPLYISEIEVDGEYDFGRLEVEAHIVDAHTGRLLGCAGGRTGLRYVDSAYVFYEVHAEFIRPEGGVLYFEDVQQRDIEIWIIEDDEAECPGPFVPGEDDIIGISRAIPGRDLDRMINLRFDDVVHLQIGS